MEFCTKFHKLLEHLKSKILNISVDKIVRNQYLRINNYIYVMFIRYDNPPPPPISFKRDTDSRYTKNILYDSG